MIYNMKEKIFISADSLLDDAFKLAQKILVSDYKPSFIVALWRGGAPIGIAIQELLEHRGVKTNHIALRTSSYIGIDSQEKKIQVHGLDYLATTITETDNLLIVDDVFDSGRSLESVIVELRRRCPKNYPNKVRIATTYYKPTRNKSILKPDFFVHETDLWLVFPHELQGLTDAEIKAHKPTSEARVM